MTPEQRQELIRLLQAGEEISPEWARVLFPPEKRTRHNDFTPFSVLGKKASTLYVATRPIR
ncbi:MAG: hypothetical protein C3F12_06285 [Candidatus Methylomirabilota bacterium]|nr:MAG: hypothetical protein C3F12_06285 [candidate division NC10 bacterium]